MKGSCAVRRTCCAAFSSTGTPRVHIFTGAAFSATCLEEAKRWLRNSYDLLFSYAVMANLQLAKNHHTGDRAVTTRIGETPALSAELRAQKLWTRRDSNPRPGH